MAYCNQQLGRCSHSLMKRELLEVHVRRRSFRDGPHCQIDHTELEETIVGGNLYIDLGIIDTGNDRTPIDPHRAFESQEDKIKRKRTQNERNDITVYHRNLNLLHNCPFFPRISTRSTALQRGTSRSGLNDREPPQLPLVDVDAQASVVLPPQSQPSTGFLEKPESRCVEALVVRSTRGTPRQAMRHGRPASLADRFSVVAVLGWTGLSPRTVVAHERPHTELDEVQREKPVHKQTIRQKSRARLGIWENVPDDVPDPDDPDPTARNGLDVGETPVGDGGDGGRDTLCDAESAKEGVARSFGEEEAVRSGDEDEGLRDLGNFQVDWCERARDDRPSVKMQLQKQKVKKSEDSLIMWT